MREPIKYPLPAPAPYGEWDRLICCAHLDLWLVRYDPWQSLADLQRRCYIEAPDGFTESATETESCPGCGDVENQLFGPGDEKECNKCGLSYGAEDEA